MKAIFYIFLFSFISFHSFAQSIDSTQTPSFVRGQITATQNGVSLIPNFSLNRPALMFDMNIGRGRLSFDPMIRFGMDGKPWSFIFWWRYKVIQQKKFMASVGAHPSVVFRDVSAVNNGITKNYLNAQRYFAWENTNTYFLNKDVNFTLNYLGSHGLTSDITQFTHFLALRSGLGVHLSKNYTLGLVPQVYYLKMDAADGLYTNLIANFYKKNLPISLNGVVSQALQTSIAGKEFLWSVGLVYNINNTYLKHNSSK